HDPILAYCFLLQFVCAFFFASLILLDSYLETGRRQRLAASLFCYLLAVLTYEVAWPFFLLHILLIYLRSSRRLPAAPVPSAGWFLLAGAVMLLLPLVLRWAARTPLFAPEGVSSREHRYLITTSPALYLEALLRQTVAALPLSYVLGQRGSPFDGTTGSTLA